MFILLYKSTANSYDPKRTRVNHISPTIIFLKKGMPAVYDARRPVRLFSYIVQKAHTAVLVVRKKSVDEESVARVRRPRFFCEERYVPMRPARIMLVYTVSITPTL